MGIGPNRQVSSPDELAPLALARRTADFADTQIQLKPSLNLLVVDDVYMNRDLAAYFLRAAGHRVACLASGEEAVAAVATTDFDLVLMDLSVPIVDGLQATRRIRALTGSRGQVPILALTARAFADYSDICREVGMNGHVSKPFDPDGLLDAVVKTIAAGPQKDAFSSAIIPVPESRAAGSDLMVLEPRTYDRTVASLAPHAVIFYLKALAVLGEALLRMLHASDAVAPTRLELAAAAHAVASSASMFGFQRLTTLGRQFEQATWAGTSDAPILSSGLRAALKVTLDEIDRRMVASPGGQDALRRADDSRIASTAGPSA